MSALGATTATALLLAASAHGVPVGLAGPWWDVPLLTDGFDGSNGPNGLIANEYAFWNPERDGVRSPVWEETSGSLFARAGHGWTGRPDLTPPDAASRNGTDSRVLRLRTRRADFGSVRQQVQVRIAGFVATDAGGRPWDGVVLWPRYATPRRLYFAYLLRRDGVVQLTKKCPGRLAGGGFYNGGTYFALTAPHLEAVRPTGRWYDLATEVRDRPDGSVAIRAFRDGRLVASAVDRGVGCAPIRGPARLGVRGDGTEFELDDYRVSRAAGRSATAG